MTSVPRRRPSPRLAVPRRVSVSTPGTARRRAAQRGEEAEQDDGAHRHREGERQAATVHGHLGQAREPFRRVHAEEVTAPHARSAPRAPPPTAMRTAFRPGAGAPGVRARRPGRTYRQLTGALRPSREKQARHVHAGDEQQERDGGHHPAQHAPHRTHHAVAVACDRGSQEEGWLRRSVRLVHGAVGPQIQLGHGGPVAAPCHAGDEEGPSRPGGLGEYHG